MNILKLGNIDLIQQRLINNNWVLSGKKIYHEDNYEQAYKKLYRNTGTVTPGHLKGMYKVYGKLGCLTILAKICEVSKFYENCLY